jgi:HEPN domain-containing protein
MKVATQNWLNLAAEDYDTCLYLLKGGRYPYAVYLLCQAIEKLLKAAQIEFAHLAPKKIHDLRNLAKDSGLEFSEDQRQQLKDLTKHYERVRYRDLAQADYNTKAKVTVIMEPGKELYQWIFAKFNNR